MDPDEFMILTVPGWEAEPDHTVYVRLDAVVAVEEIPSPGRVAMRVHLANGTAWAVREVPSDLFEELP